MKPVFIGGCPRSGSTMLSAMLGAHPSCITVPEAAFKLALIRLFARQKGRVTWPEALARVRRHPSLGVQGWGVQADSDRTGDCSVQDVTEYLVALYASRHNDRTTPDYWIDQTPGNIRFTKELLAYFPNVRYVHLVRDGRAVAASVRRLKWGPTSVSAAARWWMGYIATGLAAESFLGPTRVYRVRYEDLVKDPKDTLRGLSSWLGLGYHEMMAEGGGFRPSSSFHKDQHRLVGSPPDASRCEAWKTSLSPREIEVFEYITGDLLALFGHELVYGVKARRLRWHEWCRFYLLDGLQPLNKAYMLARRRRFARRHVRESGRSTPSKLE